MMNKMVGGAINALVGAIKIVFLFGVLVGLLVWAKADPDSWKALMAQVAGAGMALISWLCRLIVDLIPKSSPAAFPSAGRGPPVLHTRAARPTPSLASTTKGAPIMAARFQVPQPRPSRRRRPGSPPLALVPDRLAPVLPMPRPAARPARLVLLSCRPCDLAADPMPAAEAEHAAGVHDDDHHAGQPTAELRTDPRPAYTLGGPNLGGAARAACRARSPGPSLVAFFGCMYYAATRPAEAAELRCTDIVWPAAGDEVGELRLNASNPTTALSWTDNGRREPRQLKHRGRKEVRVVPCPPPLVHLLRHHLAEYGTASDGRLFRGERGGPVSDSVYGRVWARARVSALTPTEVASPLADRPYALRHAAVSTWLNAGVDSTQVAEWAGHSVHVLLRVYAKCVSGRDAVAKDLVAQHLSSSS